MGKSHVQTLYAESGVFGSPGNVIIVGEQVICAKDWRISGIHGPQLPLEYKLYPWVPKEEWFPWNWKQNQEPDDEDVKDSV
jgi:hypothetical protein